MISLVEDYIITNLNALQDYIINTRNILQSEKANYHRTGAQTSNARTVTGRTLFIQLEQRNLINVHQSIMQVA